MARSIAAPIVRRSAWYATGDAREHGNRARRWLYGRDLAVWYAPEYRWPLSALEARTGLQNRRADFAAWFLLERRALARSNLRKPRRAEYEELARVHTPELLDSLGQAETLAARPSRRRAS
jgi:hypothetical protein